MLDSMCTLPDVVEAVEWGDKNFDCRPLSRNKLNLQYCVERQQIRLQSQSTFHARKDDSEICAFMRQAGERAVQRSPLVNELIWLKTRRIVSLLLCRVYGYECVLQLRKDYKVYV